MARLKVRHLEAKPSGYYYHPTRKMKAAGFRGEALGTDAVAAMARAEALNAEWDAIRAGDAAPPSARPGTLRWLIGRYQQSTWWTDLAESTRGEARRHIAYIEASPLGEAQVTAIARPELRLFYDKCAAAQGVWKAGDVHKYLSRILSYGVELGLIASNPASKMGIKEPKPRRIVWTEEQVGSFIAKALELGFPGWARAVSIAYDSGQDLMVILGRQWHDFDGEGLDFRRQKTGIASWSPCSERTMGLIEGPRTSIYICTTPQGRPINSRSYFGRVFREIRKEAGLPALRFRDLRRTVGTEIYAGGGRIEPILGLTPGSPVQKHYIVPDKAASRESAARRKRER